MTRSILVCAAGALSAALTISLTHDVRLHGQATPSPSFDVASIKRNRGGSGAMMRALPGYVTSLGVTARQLIRQAYALQDFQIVGGPDWIASDRFDVEAKFDATPVPGLDAPARMQAMMRTLLAERFKLAAHTETRDLPILALVLARRDGQLGPQLKKSLVDCQALAAARRGGPPPDGRGGPPLDGRRGGGPGPFSLGERPQCGGRGGFGQMIAGGLPMSQFVTQLSQLTSRVVIDRTGLAGGYDIDLKYAPTPDQLPPGPPPPGFEPPPIDPNGPSLFTALEEQLGLTLDSQRGPVEVLVIDRIEPPTEN